MRINNYPKVSIVVPVYNSKNCLNDCLKSLLCQTYKNIEIVLVDDGSSDGSRSLILNAVNKNPQKVKGVYQKNMGVSVARNSGINNSSGEYIGFVDSDDVVDKKFVSKMVERFSKDVSLVSCKFYRTSSLQNKEFNNLVITGEKNYNKDYFLENLARIPDAGYVANKLFRLDIIKSKNIFFNSRIAIHEDFLFCVQYLKKCIDSKVVFLESELYIYILRNESASNSVSNTRNPTKVVALEKVLDLLEKKSILYNDILKDLVNLKLASFFAGHCIEYFFDKKNLVKFKENEFKHWKMLTLKHKIMLLLLAFFPKSCLYFINIRKNRFLKGSKI